MAQDSIMGIAGRVNIIENIVQDLPPTCVLPDKAFTSLDGKHEQTIAIRTAGNFSDSVRIALYAGIDSSNG